MPGSPSDLGSIKDRFAELDAIVQNFNEEDAARIKKIEKTPNSTQIQKGKRNSNVKVKEINDELLNRIGSLVKEEMGTKVRNCY